MKDNRTKVRAWIYEVLAQLETCDDVEANKSESSSTTTLIIKYK